MKKVDAIHSLAIELEQHDKRLIESLQEQAHGRDECVDIKPVPRDYKVLATELLKAAQVQLAFNAAMATLRNGDDSRPMAPKRDDSALPSGYEWKQCSDAHRDYSKLINSGWTLDTLVERGIVRKKFPPVPGR